MSTISDRRPLASEIEGTRYADWKLHHVLVDQMADGRAHFEFVREQMVTTAVVSRPTYVKTTAVFADVKVLYDLLAGANSLERLVDGL